MRPRPTPETSLAAARKAQIRVLRRATSRLTDLTPGQRSIHHGHVESVREAARQKARQPPQTGPRPEQLKQPDRVRSRGRAAAQLFT